MVIIFYDQFVLFCQFFMGGNNWWGFGANKNVMFLIVFDGLNGMGNFVLFNFLNLADGFFVDLNNWNIFMLNFLIGQVFFDVVDDGMGGSCLVDECGYIVYDYNGVMVCFIVVKVFMINVIIGDFVVDVIFQWIGVCVFFMENECFV